MRLAPAFFASNRHRLGLARAMFPEIIPDKTKPMVIGVSGPAHSGKDTIADWFVANRGFKAVSFAGPLKRAVSELFDIPLDSMFDPAKKELVDARWKTSPRALMQWLGTDVMRNQVDKEFFVKHLGWRLEKMVIEEGHNVIVTDVRFDNEAELIRAFPRNCMIRVDASERIKKSPLAKETRTHATELGVSEAFIDHVVDNNTSIESLYEQLDALDALYNP